MNFARKRSILVIATFALRLFGQGISFFIFARVLGSNNFGIVIATLAIVSPISPLIDLGVYSIVSRDIALGLVPQKIINENISTMFISVPIGMIIIILATVLFNKDIGIIITFKIALAYILISRMSLIMSAIQNSINQNVPVIWAEALSAFLLIALGIYGIFSAYDIMFWSNMYLLIALLFTITTMIVISRHIGPIKINLNIPMSRIREGLVFSMGNSAQYIYTDVDKIFIFKFVSSGLAGIYGVVGRISTLILTPIGAIYSIFFPRFMIAGSKRGNALQDLLIYVLKLSLAYSFVVCLLVYSLSSYIPYFLGSDYESVPSFLKLLLWPIVFQILQVPFADTLTGLGHQRYRSQIQIVAAAIAIIGNWLLVPRLGVNGAIFTLTFVHLFILCSYIYVAFKSIKSKDLKLELLA